MPRAKGELQRKYTLDKLRQAIDHALAHPKMQIQAVANMFGVPRTTLSGQIVKHKRGEPMGISNTSRTALTPEEEEHLVAGMIFANRAGAGLNREDVGSIIKDYLEQTPERANPFKNNTPGRDWMRSFYNRHKDKLSERNQDGLAMKRSAKATPEVVNAFFDLYEDRLKDLGMDTENPDPTRIYNLDETGLNGKCAKRVFVEKGEPHVYLHQPTEGKVNYTVMVCVSGNGEYLPPFTIYKASSEHMFTTWTKGGPENATFSRSPSGWMSEEAFESWMLKVFIPHKLERHGLEPKVLLIYDGYGSHMTFMTSKYNPSEGLLQQFLTSSQMHILSWLKY